MDAMLKSLEVPRESHPSPMGSHGDTVIPWEHFSNGIPIGENYIVPSMHHGNLMEVPWGDVYPMKVPWKSYGTLTGALRKYT